MDHLTARQVASGFRQSGAPALPAPAGKGHDAGEAQFPFQAPPLTGINLLSLRNSAGPAQASFEAVPSPAEPLAGYASAPEAEKEVAGQSEAPPVTPAPAHDADQPVAKPSAVVAAAETVPAAALVDAAIPVAEPDTPADTVAPVPDSVAITPAAPQDRATDAVPQPLAEVPVPAAPMAPPELALAVSPKVTPIDPPMATPLPEKAPTRLATVPKPVQSFDLGAIKAPAPASQPKGPALAASKPLRAVARAGTRGSRPVHGLGGDRVEGDAIFHQALVSFDDRPASKLSIRIGMAGDLSLRLGDLLALYKTDMAPSAFTRLSGASAADEFVSFETLRDAGIDIRYDAGRDRLVISSRS